VAKSPIGDGNYGKGYFNCLLTVFEKNHRSVKLPCNAKITGSLNYTQRTQPKVLHLVRWVRYAAA